MNMERGFLTLYLGPPTQPLTSSKSGAISTVNRTQGTRR